MRPRFRDEAFPDMSLATLVVRVARCVRWTSSHFCFAGPHLNRFRTSPANDRHGRQNAKSDHRRDDPPQSDSRLVPWYASMTPTTPLRPLPLTNETAGYRSVASSVARARLQPGQALREPQIRWRRPANFAPRPRLSLGLTRDSRRFDAPKAMESPAHGRLQSVRRSGAHEVVPVQQPGLELLTRQPLPPGAALTPLRMKCPSALASPPHSRELIETRQWRRSRSVGRPLAAQG